MKICIIACALLFALVNCSSIGKRLNAIKSKDTSINLNSNVKTGNGGWHIHVTMHVYSGRSDPKWLIPEHHPTYNLILDKMGNTPAKPIPSKLGYKGFSLVHLPPGKDITIGGHYNRTVTSYPDWEMLLLHTSNGLGDGLKEHARHSILEPTVRRKRRSALTYPDYDYGNYGSLFGLPTQDPIDALTDTDMYKLAVLWGLDKKFLNITTTPVPSGPTRFEPEKWNKYFVQDHNNCYNYANNRITDTFSQPGRAGKCKFGRTAKGADIENVAKCDGLRAVAARQEYELPAHRLNLVALVFWPPKTSEDMFDYHWFRLDGNGYWSHKPGKTEATNVDNSKKHIKDPRHADRGPYKQFVGFMETSQDSVLII